jgi:hypothetical protein
LPIENPAKTNKTPRRKPPACVFITPEMDFFIFQMENVVFVMGLLWRKKN